MKLAFLSYSHFNDQMTSGKIRGLLRKVDIELQQALGVSQAVVFIDRDDIHWGQRWREAIDSCLFSPAILIPVLSPHFLESAECVREYELFLTIEHRFQSLPGWNHKNRLVLPLVFREIPDDLESHTVWQDAKTSVYDRIQEHCESRSLEYRPVRTFVKGLAKEVIRLRQEMQDSIEAYERFCSSTSDDYLLVALDKFSHALLKSNRFLDDGTWLERPTVADLRGRVRSNQCSTTFLLGHAGVGKSSILATAAANFISSGNVILAIKADALTFPCNSLRDLELAICPSLLPNRTLLRELRLIARTRPVVVIFDQLDALSRLSDIHSERLHVLLTFIQQFRGVQGIHVMISCRNTEMADLRLSAKLPVDLTPDVVLQVQPLDRKQVEDLLISRDIDISGIPDRCIEDLRVPVNLMDFLSDPNGFLSRWRESSS